MKSINKTQHIAPYLDLAKNSVYPEAKKSLGQNFLVDEAIAKRIVLSAHLSPDDTVIEIGPGTGALTRFLLQRCKRVFAIELDQRLIPLLPNHPTLKVVHGDALEMDFKQLVADDDVAISSATLNPPRSVTFIANLPYYITSAAIRHMLECGVLTRSIVIMVQLEVAQRIVAQPGDMSLLAVSVQFYGKTELLFRVPPSAFKPQPNVDSAVIRITPHAQAPTLPAKAFFSVVKAGFCQPRKQLRNTLASGLNLDKAMVDQWLQQANIAPSRRAETLSLAEWERLCRQQSPHIKQVQPPPL